MPVAAQVPSVNFFVPWYLTDSFLPLFSHRIGTMEIHRRHGKFHTKHNQLMIISKMVCQLFSERTFHTTVVWPDARLRAQRCKTRKHWCRWHGKKRLGPQPGDTLVFKSEARIFFHRQHGNTFHAVSPSEPTPMVGGSNRPNMPRFLFLSSANH